MTSPAESTVASWAVRLIDELTAADQHALRLARGLSRDQINWKPEIGVWSVGQCLQHLHITNCVYLPAIASALEDCPSSPVEDIRVGWFGRWFITNYIEPSARTKRARAPRKITPEERIEPSIVEALLESNQLARDLVRRASAYDVNRIRFRNPFVPLLRFTVGTGFEVVSKHERRHLLQAERIRQAAQFPAH